MLVIHPYDSSTDFLSEIYKDKPNVTLFNEINDVNLDEAITAAMDDKELTMFLGHGCPYGLFSINPRDDFDDMLLIDEYDAKAYLSKRKNLFGMWCEASMFARAQKLSGLWSGMIISEVFEAAIMKIKTCQEEVTEENLLLARNVRYCLDNYPLSEIPAVLKTMDKRKSELTNCNYQSWYF